MESPISTIKKLQQKFLSNLYPKESFIIVAVILSILSALSLTALIIGSVEFNQCPIQPLIPVWLVVGGAVGIAFYIYWMSWVSKDPFNFQNRRIHNGCFHH